MEKLRPETWLHHKTEKTGVRLDSYLAEKYSELSRSRVQKLIDDQHILVNDKPAKANHKLKGEEKIVKKTLRRPLSPYDEGSGEQLCHSGSHENCCRLIKHC